MNEQMYKDAEEQRPLLAELLKTFTPEQMDAVRKVWSFWLRARMDWGHKQFFRVLGEYVNNQVPLDARAAEKAITDER